MNRKRSLIAFGIIPSDSGVSPPYIVNVLPEPVWPYAKMVEW